ncbi:MAG: hypothetical protein H6555_06795 [Lewinellaceae bacterium]|nr:hypothetical protein [Lewinellaceae bacterium]
MNFGTTCNHALLLLSLPLFLLACHEVRPNSTPEKQDSQPQPSIAIATGDTVATLGPGVRGVFQDSNEQYWFGGGNDGVYKYDGKSLVLFTTNDGLCSNAIIGMQEDQKGNMYFETQEGISKFDGQMFTTLPLINNDPSRNEWKLTPDDLWFSMGWDKSGPYRYDGHYLHPLVFPETRQEAEYWMFNPNASYRPNGIYTIYKDSQGAMWFGTASLGVYRFDGQSVRWLYEKQLTETPAGGEFGIRSIIEDAEGYFWFCNTEYRYEILPNSSAKKNTSQLPYTRKTGIGHPVRHNEQYFPYFMSVIADDNGDLWMVSYDEGVWRNTGKELIHYPIKDGDANVLLYSIYQDKQGTLWVTSQQNGLYQYNGKTFIPFTLPLG